jgi:hypothetical protein
MHYDQKKKKKKKKKIQSHAQGECHVVLKADTGALGLQVKDCWQLSREIHGANFSLQVSIRNQSCLLLEFILLVSSI